MNRVAAMLVLLGAAVSQMPWAGAAEPDFNRDIRPLLSKHCFACHGPDEKHREAGLRLDVRDSATHELESGSTAIVAAKPAESELLARIKSSDPDVRMPPPNIGPALDADEVSLLERWIAAGAPYAEHWSLVRPVRPPLPMVKDAAWPANYLDRFILARIEQAGLHPSPEADRHVLIRRLSLDLRGLPPTPAEVDRFVNDRRVDAYARLVERFLADPAYGERWARLWLDLARYADSQGYGSDALRTIWRYRDWVIGAFNRNLPFDQFTIEQLAGDLLPGATPEQLMATAFNRNTLTNTEGGTDDEEFRVEAIKDRVDTTMQVWMGLTMGCAKCHNHKYDPLAQREYYQLFAIYNQSADADRGDEEPTMLAPPAETIEQIRRADERIAQLQKQLATSTPELAAAQQKWEASLAPVEVWKPLAPPAEAKADDKSHTIEFELPASEVSAVRLELLPAGSKSKAAIASCTLRAKPVTPPAARYVQIELPGENKILSLAEVQVFGPAAADAKAEPVNLALKGKATQSSTYKPAVARLAIDGNTDGQFSARSVAHTETQQSPWWEVDLGSEQPIGRVVVWNRVDQGSGGRLAGYRLRLLDKKRKPIFERQFNEAPKLSQEIKLLELADVPLKPTKGGTAGQTTYTLDGPIAGQFKLEFQIQLIAEKAAHPACRVQLSTTFDPHRRQRESMPNAVAAALQVPVAKRTPKQLDQLATYYRSIAPALARVRADLAAAEKSRPKPPTLPIMRELPAEKHRETFILVKGNFMVRGERVEPDLPAALPPWPAGVPHNRLGLARWLVDPANPLTARVAVNRFWSQLFGRGLVETEEDFGSQGAPPTHPQLLDWLATEFTASGWDIKQLLRVMVLSSTYRESSRVTPALLARDPQNRLYARGPRFRLEAEMVRDQSLALAGLLSHKLYGPSVFPPQPPGLWQVAFNGQRTWATSQGEDRYRRGLYTFWRRSVPYPSMATFDAPSRELCTMRRIRTNTPLQALVTLNDPVYVEAAQALARRIVREGGSNPEDRIRWALRLCLIREPEEAQVIRLATLYQSEREQYARDAKAATEVATDPLGPLPKDMEPAELAAWTVVAGVLLNLDGVLTKG
ncbi:MAG TPA: DUF1553 domain-containing protein [Pirellulales bacterium]|jgi:hypothetical protein|nr:DUF1553 domain-containing protein [Pirellulales bacterium]